MTLSIANAISPVAVRSGRGTPFTPIPESPLFVVDFDVPSSMTPSGGSPPITDGENIEQIVDTANGALFNRYTTTGPLWDERQINNQGALRDASTRLLRSAVQHDFTGGEVSAFAVHNATTASRFIFEQSASTNPNRGFFMGGISSSVCRVFDTAQVNFGANPTLDGEAHILGMRVRSGTQQCFEDGRGNLLGTNNAAIANLGTDFFYIAGRENGSLNWAEGIGYIAVYNRWLDDAEVDKMVSYLITRYTATRYVLDDSGQPLLDDAGNPIPVS